jgi:hypothetical protein
MSEYPDAAADHYLWLIKEAALSDDGFDGLSAENQRYFAVRLLEAEVYNGGFDQYFINGAADYFPEAVQGLQDMGATEWCRILLAAKQILFGTDEVPGTEGDRWERLGGWAPGRNSELEKLASLFFNEETAFQRLIVQYAQKHGLYEGF